MKDTFWFQHDSNAQHDERILELRAEFGWEGYGIFWSLVERMRDAQNYRISMSTIGGLSTGMGILKPKLLAIIELCCSQGLFALEEEGSHVFAPSLRRRMAAWDNKKATLAEAGKRGAEARQAKAKAKPPLSQGEATLKPPLSHPETTLPVLQADKIIEEEIIEEGGGGVAHTQGQAPPPSLEVLSEQPSAIPAPANVTPPAPPTPPAAPRPPAMMAPDAAPIFQRPAFNEYLASMEEAFGKLDTGHYWISMMQKAEKKQEGKPLQWTNSDWKSFIFKFLENDKKDDRLVPAKPKKGERVEVGDLRRPKNMQVYR